MMGGIATLFALSALALWGAAQYGRKLLACPVAAAPMSWQERRRPSWEHRNAWWGCSSEQGHPARHLVYLWADLSWHKADSMSQNYFLLSEQLVRNGEMLELTLPGSVLY